MEISNAIKNESIKLSDSWFNGELFETHVILDGPKEIVTDNIHAYCLGDNKAEDIVLTEIHLCFDTEDLSCISADNLTEALIGPAVESPRSISLIDFNHTELNDETVNGLIRIVKGGKHE